MLLIDLSALLNFHDKRSIYFVKLSEIVKVRAYRLIKRIVSEGRRTIKFISLPDRFVSIGGTKRRFVPMKFDMFIGTG